MRSIQNQFYDDIEIIFVDDFSTDNSVKLIEKYQKDDERILLLKHNKNKGTLITRNEGVLFSKGEYIIIPDPDDILSKDILSICYKVSKQKNLEMIRFNLLDKNTNNNVFFDFYVNNLDSRVIYQPELSVYLFYGIGYLQQIDFNLNNKFIKRLAYIRALNSMNKYYLSAHDKIILTTSRNHPIIMMRIPTDPPSLLLFNNLIFIMFTLKMFLGISKIKILYNIYKKIK